MKKYRIVKFTKSDPTRYHHMFIIEQRYMLFFWKPIMDKSFPYVPKTFMTLYAAEYFIGGLRQVDGRYKRSIEKYV
jgi:hypothetical protein